MDDHVDYAWLMLTIEKDVDMVWPCLTMVTKSD